MRKRDKLILTRGGKSSSFEVSVRSGESTSPCPRHTRIPRMKGVKKTVGGRYHFRASLSERLLEQLA